MDIRTHDIGLVPVDGEDLEEITHRINALRVALAGLNPEGLDDQEPASIFHPEVARDEA